MPLPIRIKEALAEYDRRHWLTLRPPHSSIIALKNLSSLDQSNLFKIYQCFRGNIPDTSRASYKVYCAVLVKISTLEQGDPYYEPDDDRRKPADPKEVENVIRVLDQASLLTQENFDAIRAHSNYVALHSALNIVNEVSLLTEKNFKDLVKVTFFFSGGAILCKLMLYLKQHNFLTQENFDAILQYPDLFVMGDILVVLSNRGFLTQANIDQLLNPNNHAIRMDEISRIIYDIIESFIPAHLFTQQIFDTLVALTKKEKPIQHIQEYIKQLHDDEIGHSSELYERLTQGKPISMRACK